MVICSNILYSVDCYLSLGSTQLDIKLGLDSSPEIESSDKSEVESLSLFSNIYARLSH